MSENVGNNTAADADDMHRRLEQYQKLKQKKATIPQATKLSTAIPTQRKYSERKEVPVAEKNVSEHKQVDSANADMPAFAENPLLWALLNAQLGKEVQILEESAKARLEKLYSQAKERRAYCEALEKARKEDRLVRKILPMLENTLPVMESVNAALEELDGRIDELLTRMDLHHRSILIERDSRSCDIDSVLASKDQYSSISELCIQVEAIEDSLKEASESSSYNNLLAERLHNYKILS